ncbi:MAG: DUF5674 family protein [Candidatus Paceibacterota bacterium]|jgi:hypothetical protein|nr:DUF5674 family protein [Candidatus Paceibacterota bacterium]
MELFDIRIINSPIDKYMFNELLDFELKFGGFIKIAIDIKKERIALNCELHCDCGDVLADSGSDFANIWGANIIPSSRSIEYTSLMNIRPGYSNLTQEITRQDIREKIEKIIKKLIFQNY